MTPVAVLTGFLGSGKTTLLNRWLQSSDMSGTAVIINEIGEIGIDHHLVQTADEELRLLRSGCICCTVRGDLIDTLVDLDQRRARGQLAFSRVVVETTGLADPAPLLHTLMVDPSLVDRYSLGSVVTTIDAVNALSTLDRMPEARRQVAMADVLIVTKADLSTHAESIELSSRLALLNDHADILQADAEEASAARMLLNPMTVCPRPMQRTASVGSQVHHLHEPRIQSHSFVFEHALPREAFFYWLELMGQMRGERLLRLKGIVHLAGQPDRPVVVHGAQHVLHPPRELAAWPDADRRTRLVFIVQGITREEIERTFKKFVGEMVD